MTLHDLKRPLGNTELEVSPVGLGTVKFGRNENVKYPEAFSLPDDNTIKNLLSHAQSLGINLLDTAPAYGTSEERLGKLLRSSRHDWIIISKAGEYFENGASHYDFTPHAITQSVENSLKRLQTDYLDGMLIHSDGNDMKIINQFEVFDTLENLKQKGWLRSYGMSTKTTEGGLETIRHSDMAMVSYNPSDSENKTVIDKAQVLNKGILIKKALASGHLSKLADKAPVQTAINMIFAHPGVTSVIFGTLNSDHLTENVVTVANALKR